MNTTTSGRSDALAHTSRGSGRACALTLTAALTLASALGACGFSAIEPVELLDVELAVSDSVLLPGETFTATVTVANATSRDIDFTTSTGCMTEIAVTDAGEERTWQGTRLVCTQVITTHTVPAGGSLARTLDLRAAEPDGTTAGGWVPVSEGVYTLAATTFPSARATVRVRAP